MDPALLTSLFPVGLMETPLRRLMVYCDMFGKSSILVETLEVRGVGKAQRGEATYPRSHSQRGRARPKLVTYSSATAITSRVLTVPGRTA